MSQSAYFNRFTLDLPDEAVEACSHQGQCDEDVVHWATKITFPDPELVRAELKEYGAWDREQLEDGEQNNRRLLWIAACNIKEEMRLP